MSLQKENQASRTSFHACAILVSRVAGNQVPPPCERRLSSLFQLSFFISFYIRFFFFLLSVSSLFICCTVCSFLFFILTLMSLLLMLTFLSHHLRHAMLSTINYAVQRYSMLYPLAFSFPSSSRSVPFPTLCHTKLCMDMLY